MFKNHNILGLCLTLAITVAGFSGAHAELVIDTFLEGGGQFAPPDNEIAAPSAIGGFRFLRQVGAASESVIIVGAAGLRINHIDVGGTTEVEWSGGGEVGLGGIDLTAGGDRFQFRAVVVTGTAALTFQNVTLRVFDTEGGQSKVKDLSLIHI